MLRCYSEWHVVIDFHIHGKLYYITKGFNKTDYKALDQKYILAMSNGEYIPGDISLVEQNYKFL